MQLPVSPFVYLSVLGSLAACTGGSPSSLQSVRVEFAEVVQGSPVRHLYLSDGTARDLEVKSSVVMHGSVLHVVDVPDDQGPFFGLHIPEESPDRPGPRHDEILFQLSKEDDAAFTAWTRDRNGQIMAVIFGDQILEQATINGPLSGSTSLRVPKSIRDEGLRRAIADAKKTKK